ncbi:kazrin isoform X2 [Phlebotomus argentipes]|uniref:kazrin isoform X2 n=1 Tax=Phlebotomus argentipes TaxID=94469 RepID=UPI00289382F7|nr:kazrin isoform X2 [Phlebotomus argentipes]
MQINGNSCTTMAASEPPEPPPRNPDKINASLKQISTESKAPKLDATSNVRPSQKLNNAISVSSPSPDAVKSVAEQENGDEATEDGNNSHGETDTLNGKDDNTVDSFRTTVDKPDQDSFDDLDSPQSSKLKVENQRLSAEINRLKKLLEISPDGAIGGIDLSDNNSFDAHSTDGGSSRMERLEVELRMAREQIAHLRSERKKLRTDKADLLRHVKQLCASLHDKEQELRDFIRNYEQRLRDNESTALKMTSERERERWSLMKHARDEAERSLVLAAQLNARDMQLQRTQEQLQEARRQLSGCMSDQESLISMPPPLTPPSSGLLSHLSGGFPGSVTASDSTVRGNSDKDSAAGDLNLSDGPCENGMCLTMDPDNISLVSSQHNMYQYGTPVKERSPTLSPLNSSAFSRSVDNADASLGSRSVEQLGASLDGDGSTFLGRRLTGKGTGTLGRSGRGSTWGSISKVFARSRQRARNASQEADTATIAESGWSPLTEEGYAEKLRLLREASAAPMERWRASQVLAWLEVALGMPQYSVRCSENVKSGKVLLELSDAELEAGLGLSHPMHRKKMRLAIEEQRRPDLVRYPTIGQLGHTWVASEWLPDIGLPQYAESFIHSLVDARMLDTLSKKELEKMLGVTRKFHQASIVHGIHVLRIIKYDRQELAMRRLQSESLDSDPIVWTNQRFIRWVRSIDLAEYADNLKDSGVHGGLVILEPSFSGETMATALGIPPSKNIIRRHLTAEFDALVLPARATLGQGIRSGGQIIPITGSGGLHHHGTIDRKTSGSLRFATWRGSQSSLSKVFGFTKTRPEKLFNPTSPTNSYSSEDYATVGSFFSPPPTQPPPQPPTTTPPPSLPSHRVSAPPTESAPVGCTLPRQHRRVKSISDIDVIAAAPV